MRLKAIILENFRSYEQQTRIKFEPDLTALIGKNDVGKSSILEALEIFFNGRLIKMQQDDSSVATSTEDVVIGCVFDQLPDEIVLDTSSTTTLAGEYLLNADGDLEIHKVYNCALKTPKETVCAYALHPSDENVNDLLQLKNNQLKARLKKSGITDDVDLRSNVDLRRAIWQHFSEEQLQLSLQRIPLGGNKDAKIIWDSLRKALPVYALFQSDRPSTDEDSEIQDPMKLAIEEAIRSVEDDLERIKEEVQQKATEVAQETLRKLQEMDPDLANDLMPNFKSEPRWSNLFKLSLTGDNQIPINKRGSGVRRLILLNFFRAQVEVKRREAESPSVIYAIEEPETSQHPDNQKMLLQALVDLASREDCQVIITTHVPGLAGFLPVESLRYICKYDEEGIHIAQGSDDVYRSIAENLGVLPDNRVQVLVCVEGPNDVTCLSHLSHTLHQHDSTLPSLANDPRIVLFPLGGSTLRQWVEGHYLKSLRRPEVHIYDNDVSKYQSACDAVNQRGDGSWATLTGKRELENYLHPEAIYEVYGVRVTFNDQDDVPLLVAETVHNADPSSSAWSSLTDEKIGKKVSKVKRRLNSEAAQKMTVTHIQEIDPDGHIESWLQRIASSLNGRVCEE